MNTGQKPRLIVGISGSSGLPYGTRLLEVLRKLATHEVHLILTDAAKLNISVETDWRVKDVEALADVVHNVMNISASIASGSFRTEGMIVAPCSIRTLSAITHSFADNLLVRAADVVLKERRRLVVMPREAPLHTGHCKLLYEASLLGIIVFPPMPTFYGRPRTIDDMVDTTIGRVLDLLGIDAGLVKRWTGVANKSKK
ncbi:MAG: 3-octaprenyl-4-hydroxybenzoate carboxy-lyase [Acidobacteria bacterium]|nr:MAG: 3-octaprenyl-4-hydroxybenzoate carboxy-lyase [Acidobacteria bacterium 13_1_40CM_4_58_4]PYT61357.1 MAG: 3-octaprenyl-4-hydroxybenzoate carboxy-lyase [Acidobacteriota bacterium]